MRSTSTLKGEVMNNVKQRRQDPTPKQIRDRCRRIREDWSESTLRQRAGEELRPWTVPVTRAILSGSRGGSEVV